MKAYISKRPIHFMILFACILFMTSCEQEYFEPNTSAAPGGGTVTTYKAYTLSSTDPGGENVYGRVVFYKYSATVTLVQMGLYNTDTDASYTAEIYTGALADGSTSVVKALDGVSGATGTFVSSKYFTITDATFFDGLSGLDANVKIKLGEDAVAAGDIGANAAPVAEQD